MPSLYEKIAEILEKGEKDNAIFMYQKAIYANPKYYKAYYNLANIYLNEERYNIAIENYKEMEETMRSAIISAQRTSEEILRLLHQVRSFRAWCF